MTFYNLMTRAEWSRLVSGLGPAPPAYVFVQEDHAPLIAPGASGAPLGEFLAQYYALVRSGPLGRWFERRAS